MQQLIEDIGFETNVQCVFEIAEKLIETEKQQIVKAYNKGADDAAMAIDVPAEQYYNETFKND